MVCTGEEEELKVTDKQVYSRMSVALKQDIYWSSTMTSSCWVYCWAKRRARSFASDLSDVKYTSKTLVRNADLMGRLLDG